MMSTGMIYVTLMLLTVFSCIGYGAKILMVPANVNSHMIYFSRLGEGLAALGHSVYMIAPSNARIPLDVNHSNFTTTLYYVKEEKPFINSERAAELMVSIMLAKTVLQRLYVSLEADQECSQHLQLDCVQMFGDAELLKKIEMMKFDFAIMDAISTECFLVLPYSLGIPYGIFSISFFELLYRVPRLPSFVSIESYTDEMTFFQRLNSFLIAFLTLAILPDATPFASKHAPHVPPITTWNLIETASAWFYLEDLSTSYPRPTMPNTVSIGDIMARPGKPIPPDLDQIIEASPEGVILVSLGSYFEHVPDFIAQKLCESFQGLPYRFIWKSSKLAACSNAKNIVFLSWIPQNDLLAQEKVRLFITHGGINSIVESIYHGKPMIVLPIAIDQPANAASVATKGYGVYINPGEFSVKQLSDAIETVLSNPEFAQRVARASKIFMDKQHSPAERASFLIDHVVKYGDSHLRTGAFKLNIFQFLMFDIFLLIVTIAVVLLSLFLLAAACLCKMGKRCFPKRVRPKAD